MNAIIDLEKRGLIAQTSNWDKINTIFENEKVCFYIGFDPTADSLHVGHLVQLLIIKRLQLVGHKAICLFGGGTGLIGDPSLKNSMRRILTKEEIKKNIDNFIVQASRFIDVENLIIVNNADWICSLNYIEFLKEVGVYFSVNRMLAADCYKQRLETGLTFFELNYMIMQSYDFWVLNEKFGCSVQIGGNDQWSNILAGVDLIRKKSKKEVFAVTTELLTTSDGRKMGKTEAGALWLDPLKTSVYDFFQYFKNIDDKDIIKFLKVLTLLDIDEIENYEKDVLNNPNEIKEIMAFEITSLVHSTEEASKALKTSKNLFGENLDSEGIPEVKINSDLCFNDCIKVIELIKASNFAKSNSEAVRLITQGGIFLNGVKVNNKDEFVLKSKLQNGVILKKGKKKFIKCIL